MSACDILCESIVIWKSINPFFTISHSISSLISAFHVFICFTWWIFKLLPRGYFSPISDVFFNDAKRKHSQLLFDERKLQPKKRSFKLKCSPLLQHVRGNENARYQSRPLNVYTHNYTIRLKETKRKVLLESFSFFASHGRKEISLRISSLTITLRFQPFKSSEAQLSRATFFFYSDIKHGYYWT